MIKRVTLLVDNRIDVEAVRAKLAAILESCESWGRLVPPILQVTDCKKGAIELRALCSAKEPPAAWDLHCTLRERLVAYVRGLENGEFLLRRHIAIVDSRQHGHPDAGASRVNGAAPSDVAAPRSAADGPRRDQRPPPEPARP